MGFTVHLYSIVTDARLLIIVLNNPAMPGNDNDNRFHSSVDNRTPRAYQKNVILSRVKIPIVSISRPGVSRGVRPAYGVVNPHKQFCQNLRPISF